MKNIKWYLDDNEIEMFQSSEIQPLFLDHTPNEFKWALGKLIKLEYSKIGKDKYCRNTFRDEYVIGGFLTSDATIAYWSALNIYGLTEQFPNKIYVQTTKKKTNKLVFGVEYQFIRVHPKKMTGIVKRGIGSHRFRITDMEKTILDCFDKVEYSGGFAELIRALVRTKINASNMIAHSEAIGNKAAVKRIGYLAELFEKKGFKQFIAHTKKQKSKNFDLLDVYGNKTGKYNSDWNLILNIEKKDLLEIGNSIY